MICYIITLFNLTNLYLKRNIMKQNNNLLNFLKVAFFSLLLIGTSPVRAEIKVVTTIKPLHSLVANVMDGVGEPSLIIEGSTSPHSFTLKPSHAKLLEEADLIFWIGEGIETFMERPLESIVKNAEVVEFMEVESIEKLKFREESIFGEHDDMMTMMTMTITMKKVTMIMMITTKKVMTITMKKVTMIMKDMKVTIMESLMLTYG